ncbi:MAG: hypothetical protein ACYTEI_05155 [Planctomycetota bacterium]|jgi:hypothetical protein
MQRTTTGRFAIAALTAGIASTDGAQQFTTVGTHGLTVGAKGLWGQGMADAIIAGEGTAYRYDPGDGRWQLVASHGLPGASGQLGTLPVTGRAPAPSASS